MSDIGYEKIICEKEHNGKECSFSKKTLTKLKMLATIGAFTALTVVTFSGCASIRKDVEELKTTQPTSSYIQMAEETSTTKHRTTQPAVESTTQTTTQILTEPTNQSTTKPVKETTTQLTTQPITKPLVETTTQQTIQENTTKKHEEQNSNIDKEYNELFKQLNKELNKKSFSEEVNELFVDTFKRLYNNYHTWQNGYKDLPNSSEYIKSNLIDVIKNIEKINYYEKGTKKGDEMEEQGNALAWTTFDENDKLVVTIIAAKPDKADEDERNRDIERFYHEIAHCKQANTMIYSSNYFQKNEKTKNLYLEGAATFHMKFTNPLTEDIGGIWSVENKKGDLIINYNKDTGLGYLVDLNAYEKLVYLVGYNTMDKVEKGEAPLSIVEKTIAEKYGKKQASEFLQTMEEWYAEYNKSYKSDKVCNLSIELENEFLEFVKQDINSSKNKDKIEEKKRVWSHYKKRNLPEVTDGEEKNITNKIFNVKLVDNALKSKEQDNEIER